MRKNLCAVIVVCCLTVGLSGYCICPDTPGSDYKAYLGEYLGVVAFSNGNYTGQNCDPEVAIYQCVQYFKRFEEGIFGLTVGSVGTAGQIFGKAQSGAIALTAYPNGGQMQPMPTDALCFSGGTGGTGHIAIVTGADENHVYIIEQNWSRTSCHRTLPLTISGGLYSVGSGSSSYQIQGWLRNPNICSVVNTGICATTPEACIQQCYLSHGGAAVIGNPANNGGGTGVHAWYSSDGMAYVHIQDFYNQLNNSWSAIVCAPGAAKAYLLQGAIRYQYMQSTDAPKLYGAPTTNQYATISYPILPDGAFNCAAGKSKCYVRQDFSSGKLFIWDGYYVWLGDNTCNSSAKSQDLICNGQPAEFTIAASAPTPAGSFDLSAVADSPTSIYLVWSDSLYNGQFYQVLCNGAEIAKVAGRQFSHFPIASGMQYRYQVTVTNLSGYIFGYSNEVLATTPLAEPPAPPPDSFPNRVVISLSQTVWAYATSSEQTGNCMAAQVFDQYGQVMPTVRVVYVSSDTQTFAVDGDSGWCIANGLGSAQVWAEVYDWRGIQSEKLTVTVAEQLPPIPIPPDVFDSAPLKLDGPIEILSSPPNLEHQQFAYAVTVGNPTSAPITFWGPRLFTFDLEGHKVDDSSYSSAAKTLQPNESYRWVGMGQFQSAGNYYLMAMISLTGEYAGQWYVINQTADGIANKLYYRSVSQSDLRPDLRALGFWVKDDISIAGQPIQLIAMVINRGDADAAVPFIVTAQIRGRDKQVCEIAGLSQGNFAYGYFNLPLLSEGTYTADLQIDSGNAVLEYDKSNNTSSLNFIVEPASLPPVILVNPQSQTVFAESQASFIIMAVRPNPPDDPADDPLSYQWQKDGTDIANTTDSFYLISNAGFDHNGSYACAVATAKGKTALSAAASLTVLPKPLPNLVCKVTPAKETFYANEEPQVKVIVDNSGSGEAAACRFVLRLAQGNLIAETGLPSLAAGEASDFTITISSLSVGDWPIVGIIDFGNEIAESDETDNSATAFLRILPPPLPDLSITGLTPNQSQYLTTENPQLNVTIGNSGSADSPACQLAVKDAGGTILATANGPALAAGQSQTLSVALPKLTAGSWLITAAVDSQNAIAESDENNNAAITSFTVTEPVPPPKLPDLVVSKTSCQPYRWFFGLVYFSAQIKNTGQTAAGQFRISIYVPELKKTFTKNMSGLAANTTAMFDLTLWQTPKALTFRITADSQNLVAESNEQNNYLEVRKSF